MAVATATAIGLATTAATTGMSFAQANKQKKAQRKAEIAADKAMSEARKRLDINYLDALSIQKEPYERQREALLSAGAQAMQAGVESDRGGAATAGRVLAAQQEAQGSVRDQMNKDLFNLEASKAEEDSRLRDLDVNLDLQELSGAQAAAAQADTARNIALQQGIQGGVNLLQGAAQLPALYKQNTSAMKSAIGGLELTPEQIDQYKLNNVDLSKIKGMGNREFKDFLQGLSNEQRNILISESGYNPTNTNPFNIYKPSTAQQSGDKGLGALQNMSSAELDSLITAISALKNK